MAINARRNTASAESDARPAIDDPSFVAAAPANGSRISQKVPTREWEIALLAGVHQIKECRQM